MPSVTRTTTAVAAALPLLFLSGGQLQQTAAQHIPADCFVTSTYDYGSDTLGLVQDLDAAQADLALRAKDLGAHLTGPDGPDVWQVRAQARALDALSRPDAHRTERGSSASLTAYDSHGQVIAEADYGAATQVFLNPTRADGYLLQSLTFPVEPVPGHESCAVPGSWTRCAAAPVLVDSAGPAPRGRRAGQRNHPIGSPTTTITLCHAAS